MGEDERAPGVTGGQVGRVLTPWESSVGGIPLARILPCRERVSIGPFVELERVGPLYMEPGIGLQMGPIPRVGVATITYPIQGEVIHRDSLGTEQLLTPGDLNLVVAGSGLTASERSPQDVLEAGGVLDGLRMTLLLEEQDSDCDPRFVRYPADDLVSTEGEGWFARVLIGTGLGVTSPCQFAGAFLADVTLAAGARLDFEADFAERGALAAERDACIEGV
ncbi:MAG: pirin family protein, partial [Planctomycetota bacterium]